MSDCLILNTVSCATPECSKAMNQMFKCIEDACAIHHDKLYGLSSYITTALHTSACGCDSPSFSSSAQAENFPVLFLVLKHAQIAVSTLGNVRSLLGLC